MARDDGAHKIGHSNNPQRRRRGLMACSSHKIELAYSTPRPEDAEEVEAFAHLLLAEHALGGEWFAVDLATAISAVDRACFGIDMGEARADRLIRIKEAGDERGYPLTRPEIIQLELSGEFGAEYAAIRRHQGHRLVVSGK